MQLESHWCLPLVALGNCARLRAKPRLRTQGGSRKRRREVLVQLQAPLSESRSHINAWSFYYRHAACVITEMWFIHTEEMQEAFNNFLLSQLYIFVRCLHLLYKSRSTWSIRITWNDEKSLGQVAFFVPLLAFCCKMMNSRMSLAVREGLSITTECPQFSSRSTLHSDKVSAITAAPETSTTWANADDYQYVYDRDAKLTLHCSLWS